MIEDARLTRDEYSGLKKPVGIWRNLRRTLIQSEIEFCPQRDRLVGFSTFGILVYVQHIGGGYEHIGYSVSGHIADEHTFFVFAAVGRGVEARCAEGSDSPASMVVKAAFMSDQDFIHAISGPVQQAVVSAVIGHQLAKKPALFIQQPKRARTVRPMVDID